MATAADRSEREDFITLSGDFRVFLGFETWSDCASVSANDTWESYNSYRRTKTETTSNPGMSGNILVQLSWTFQVVHIFPPWCFSPSLILLFLHGAVLSFFRMFSHSRWPFPGLFLLMSWFLHTIVSISSCCMSTSEHLELQTASSTLSQCNVTGEYQTGKLCVFLMFSWTTSFDMFNTV